MKIVSLQSVGLVDDTGNDIHELHGGRMMNNEDENGGHGYIEHGSIGNKIVHVFYADDNEEESINGTNI